MDSAKIFDLFSRVNITADEESLKEVRQYLTCVNEDYTICQRLRWIKNQNVILYEKYKEPIYLAILLIADEAHIMAKKMNDKLVEYKDEKNLHLG